MDRIIEQMLANYNSQTSYDQKNCIKEVVQEIVLCGLSRCGFFNEAAFYGGTALRIFYGLDRFSEDLDFSLKRPNENFSFQKYIPYIEKEVNAYGFHFSVEEKIKKADSQIKSAFLKGNTREHLFYFFEGENLSCVPANDVIKIKFEVDILPPQGAEFENKFRLLPAPYQVCLYDMPSLFAGKLHAVICRGWKSRVKGRDLYDYLFYLSKGTPFHLEHLKHRLIQTGFLDSKQSITLDDVKEMLKTRFAKIDYRQAKEDVLPFIKNPAVLDLWSCDFFCAVTESLTCKFSEKIL